MDERGQCIFKMMVDKYRNVWESFETAVASNLKT